MGVFCGNSERERRIPLAPLGPWPSSRYVRKPELLFTAPFALSGKSTAQGRMADSLHNPVTGLRQ